jgi:hypothetical protein
MLLTPKSILYHSTPIIVAPVFLHRVDYRRLFGAYKTPSFPSRPHPGPALLFDKIMLLGREEMTHHYTSASNAAIWHFYVFQYGA